MQFVALDLETTGLSTETDTIIEIAAIRFEIEFEGGIFVITNTEEHSQLIHPGRLLTQEITMITGITPEMLSGKPDFASVKDKIQDFIGDAVIVGHNVLFDIAMFASHGMDLSNNTVIDTFELSEIFSQDVESLNLGFLANRYHLIDPEEEEHRALTDTKVSIRLLLRYLGQVRKLTGIKRQLWNTLSSRDESHTLSTLSKICHSDSRIPIDIDDLFSHLLATNSGISSVKKETEEKGSTCTSLELNESNFSNPTLIETHGNPNEELDIIKGAFRNHTHITLLTPGYKTAIWMSHFLSQNSIENMVSISPDKWCSVEYIRELLASDTVFSRKKTILILKIAYWLTDTKTGLLDEMKFYGEERNMLDIFRCREDESHIWKEQYEEKTKNIPLLISDLHNGKNQKNSRYTIIKDVPLLEDIIRRRESREISFDQLYMSIESLASNTENLESKIHIADMISLIRGIYESIPDRPTGPLVSPPGAYGETYFITQAMLWHRGHKWLIHATRTLDLSWKIFNEMSIGPLSREGWIHTEYINRSIRLLVQYHSIQDFNSNITMNISDEKTKITFIPRSIALCMQPILNGSIAYGVNILFPETRAFLIREYGVNPRDFESSTRKIEFASSRLIHAEYHVGIVKSGTVILTTSQKHARDIGQALRKFHGKNTEILIQGLSGGKGKMLSLFRNKIETSILVGIIDTWRDDYDLWKYAKNIIIAKLPFDPPTDPYFLARTVGMVNNFSEYSEPIIIIRLNTLIERILESGYTGSIISTDLRLSNTEWGKRIAGELL